MIVLVVLGACAVGLLVGLARQPRPAALCDQVDKDDLAVNFGLGREPMTRSIGLFIPSDSPDTDAARQVTATLEGDLVRDGTVATFPADQITVSAQVNSDNTTVDVHAVVDPFGAEAVQEGCYRGHLTVIRNGAEPRRRDVVVDIADREKWSAVVAFAVLLFGALIGLTIKWITEALTPLAETKRRLDRLRNVLASRGYTDQDLPTPVLMLRDEVDLHVWRQEFADLKNKIRSLETGIEISLTAIGVIHRIRTRVDRQQEELGRLWRAGLSDQAAERLANLVQSEVDRLNDLRGGAWQPETIAERMQEAYALRSYVDMVDKFIALYPDHAGQEAARSVDNLLDDNDLAAAMAALRELAGTGAQKNVRTNWPQRPEDRPHRDETESQRREPTRDTWLLRHARLIAAFVSALVVTFVGFSVQYLNNPGFEDNMDDWLNLFLWAAVVELSGVSVLDVVAKLSAGAQPRMS